MYKKMKYLLYVVIFLIVCFMTMAVFTQSKNSKQQKNEQIGQEAIQVTETPIISEANVEITETEQQNQTRSEKSVINNSITFKPDDTNSSIKKTPEKTTSIEEKKYYIIRSSRFNTINTRYDKFGIITENGKYTAVAQQLGYNGILLYIFDGTDNIVWKRLIKNSTNAGIAPLELTFSGKNIILKAQESTPQKVKENIQTFEFNEAEAPDSEWDVVLTKNTQSNPDIIYPNNTIASRYKTIKKIQFDDRDYYIISYINPRLYQNKGYANRSFYLYKNYNNKLVNIYHLFDRSNRISEDVNNKIEYTITGNELWIAYNGSARAIRKIPKNMLMNASTRLQSEDIIFAPKSSVSETNIDISISKDNSGSMTKK